MALNFRSSINYVRSKAKYLGRQLVMRKRIAKVWGYATAIADHTANLKSKDIILVAMFRNEKHRLAPFINYYRALGVDHFIFVDNDSTDGGMDDPEMLAASDISLFRVSQSFAEARQGTDWMNAFLHRYCRGHWSLTVDIDEYFVFPHCETRSLSDLVTYLTDAEQQSVWSLLLDMYPKGRIEDIAFDDVTSPITQADHFDQFGYYCVRGGYQDVWVRGGPRFRKFFINDPEIAPALNKVPFVKWRIGYEYVLNQHSLSPYRLNHPHGWHNSVTGALLHFKFDRRFMVNVKQEVLRSEHYSGGNEYRKYLRHYSSNTSLNFTYGGSCKYNSSADLIKCGLISTGIWS